MVSNGLWKQVFQSHVLSFLTTCLILGIFQHVRADTPSIVLKGEHFFYENGTEFIVRGVMYGDKGRQEGVVSHIDVLAVEHACDRDIPYLRALSINTLFVDYVKPNTDHSKCMRRLAEAGIYVIICLRGITPDSYVKSDGKTVTTNMDYRVFDFVETVVDEYAQYENTLGFTTMPVSSYSNSPYPKVQIKHVKTYMRRKGYRNALVGVVHSNEPIEATSNGLALQKLPAYYSCGNKDETIDFYYFAVRRDLTPGNTCSKPNGTFAELVRDLNKATVPTIVGYNCANDEHYNYTELQTIYGASYLSGAIVNEWIDNGYDMVDSGMVQITMGVNVTARPNYNSVSSQLAAIHPTSVSMADYTPINTPPAVCPRLQGDFWTFHNHTRLNFTLNLSTALPHIPNSGMCSCMTQSLSCVSTQKDVNDESIQDTFCKNNNPTCRGVKNNWTTEEFGAYNGCTGKQKSSWILNQLHLASNKDPKNCTDGGGILQTPVSERKRSYACGEYLRQAGVDGMGRITSTPDSDLANLQAYPEHDGLSVAAKAGIGVSVSVLVGLLVLLGIWTRVRRRRARMEKAKREEEEQQEGERKKREEKDKEEASSELPSDDTTSESKSPIAEMGILERYEMAAEAVPFSMEGKDAIHIDSVPVHEIGGDPEGILELDGTPVERKKEKS